MSSSRISVKAVKSFRGMEGYGFNAKLMLDGKEVAFVIDEGNGGCFNYEWKDRNAEKELQAIAASEPPVACQYCRDCKAGKPCAEPLHKDVDWLVSEVVDAFETEKKLRSWCKKKMVFRLPADEHGSYRTMNCIFTPESRAQIISKYPDAEIINERF